MCKQLRSQLGSIRRCYARNTLATLTLALGDLQALRALFEQHLSKGRAFVPGATGVGPLEACVLVLEHEGRRHELRAEAVFVKEEGPGCGVGLQLTPPLDGAGLASLRAFVEGGEEISGPEASEAEPPVEDEEAEGDPARRGAATLQDRIRALSHAEQQRVAANGSMQERIVLERTFGANVWESLLTNPRLTIPEVAKIARKGTLPRPLVENIAGHSAWLAAPEVQRALLGNPRSTSAIVSKVLGMMSRADLVLVPQQTAYPQGVRMQAKKMLTK
jgi:hypothetical protein